MKHRNLIAILRGILPSEAVEVCSLLADAGITLIEIPLNSPRAIYSISLVAGALSGRIAIGAGTVLSVGDVDAVHGVGGTFIVSPNADPDVIAHTVAQGMQSYPGVFSPTEAFSAIGAGATGLKFFPAEVLGIAGIKAMKAVLPPAVPTYAVGGASPGNFDRYLNAGVTGFGLGTYLFKPGRKPSDVAIAAARAVSAYDNAA